MIQRRSTLGPGAEQVDGLREVGRPWLGLLLMGLSGFVPVGGGGGRSDAAVVVAGDAGGDPVGDSAAPTPDLGDRDAGSRGDARVLTDASAARDAGTEVDGSRRLDARGIEPVLDAQTQRPDAQTQTPDSQTPDAGAPRTPDEGPACEPIPEACNQRDDDCDGEVDEGLLNDCGECGPVPEEVCDGVGVDEDCDARVDEGLDCECPDLPFALRLCDGGQRPDCVYVNILAARTCDALCDTHPEGRCADATSPDPFPQAACNAPRAAGNCRAQSNGPRDQGCRCVFDDDGDDDG